MSETGRVHEIEEMGRRLSAAVRATGVSLRQMEAEYRVVHGLPDPNPMPRVRVLPCFRGRL